jgi:hypothetical protein
VDKIFAIGASGAKPRYTRGKTVENVRKTKTIPQTSGSTPLRFGSVDLWGKIDALAYTAAPQQCVQTIQQSSLPEPAQRRFI